MTPEEELDALIGGEETMKNRTSTARLFLARAMLAQVKNDLRTRDTYYDQLGGFEANELSAYLLGQMAEYFIAKAATARFKSDEELSKAHLEKSENFCKEILSSFPKSDFLELAYVGQGEIAYARKNWQAAYQWFKEAIDVAGAVTKQKEAVFGQAKTLLELERYPEAKKLFEQVASTREWRGEVTPDSIYNLGEIEFRQGRFKEAIANYQRVYAGYAEVPDPVRQSVSAVGPGVRQDRQAQGGGRLLSARCCATRRSRRRIGIRRVRCSKSGGLTDETTDLFPLHTARRRDSRHRRRAWFRSRTELSSPPPP